MEASPSVTPPSPTPMQGSEQGPEQGSEDSAAEPSDDDAFPQRGEQYVEEELPPDFWEQAHVPQGRSEDQKRRAGANPNTTTRDDAARDDAAKDDPTNRPANAPSADPTADSQALADPSFDTLQRLFPGRVIDIEAPPTAEADDGDGNAGE
ncbi:MAG: hypothetical protein WD273_12780 [Trueperaceae bacterium]